MSFDDYMDGVLYQIDRKWDDAPECEKCGDKLDDDYYYETPDGDFCWECAYDLAYDIVKGEHPSEYIEDLEDEIQAYMDEWRRTNDYWN